MSILADWLSLVKEQTLSQPTPAVSRSLADLFTVDIVNPQVAILQNDILDNNRNIKREVNAADLYDGDWPGFSQFVTTYLEFARDVDPDDMATSFDLYARVLAALQTAFANTRGAVLESTVSAICRAVVPMAISLDRTNPVSTSPTARMSYVSSLALKIFNTCRGEKLDPAIASQRDPLSKKGAILRVATLLCRLYFRLGQPGSCANVFSNIHTARLRFSVYARAQRVEYRYWLGRFYLGKNQLAEAYRHLVWAFTNCLNGARKNKRVILQFLVAAGLPLGVLPRPPLLEAYGLAHIYGPLATYLRRADYAAFVDHVNRTPWFFDHRLTVTLNTRCMLVLHRRALELLHRRTGGQNLSFQDIEQALRQSMGHYWDELAGPASSDFVAAETVCISLISQKLLLGNIYVRNRLVRLKPSGAFPSLASAYHVAGAQASELSGREAWMND